MSLGKFGLETEHHLANHQHGQLINFSQSSEIPVGGFDRNYSVSYKLFPTK